MTLDSVETVLFDARVALEARAERARERADLLGASSNAFDEGFGGAPVTPGEEEKIGRFIIVSNHASDLAGDLEERVRLLRIAESALEDLYLERLNERQRHNARKKRASVRRLRRRGAAARG